MVVNQQIMLKSISKSFGKKSILENVDVSINKGEIFGLIGQSGSGKTTLLETMVGFLKPDTGDSLFLENGVYRSVFKDQNRVKKIFGFAAQTPSFYEKLTVEENLYYFGALYGMKKKQIKANIIKLLPLVGLKEDINSIASTLSGGMQKRLDIACAMIHGPDILILDEPTADLDIILRKHIWDLIKKINAVGTTVIITSHLLQELEHLCYRVALLHKKKIKSVGGVNELRGKFSELTEIKLHSKPGNYNLILKELKKKGIKIEKFTTRGVNLILFVKDSEHVLHVLIHTLEANKEFLVNVSLNKPSLDELFETITLNERLKTNIK